MKITAKTKYKAFQPIEKLLTAESLEAIKEGAKKQFGDYYDLSFADFWNCCNGDFSVIGRLDNPTVLQVYWCKGFRQFVDDFVKVLQSLQVPQTADEKAAADGLLEVSFAEGMVVFIRDYFGLPSFKDAEKITMGEVLIARRAAYNRGMFERKFQNQQLKKMKLK